MQERIKEDKPSARYVVTKLRDARSPTQPLMMCVVAFAAAWLPALPLPRQAAYLRLGGPVLMTDAEDGDATRTHFRPRFRTHFQTHFRLRTVLSPTFASLPGPDMDLLGSRIRDQKAGLTDCKLYVMQYCMVPGQRLTVTAPPELVELFTVQELNLTLTQP